MIDTEFLGLSAKGVPYFSERVKKEDLLQVPHFLYPKFTATHKEKAYPEISKEGPQFIT